ncbi:amino acid transporter [Chloropicon primus]|uniref:Amino acid transporter n=1 Tax=Chloropicon primus TaxID=1764295 RepID=A0A5B8MUG0_9CHLO|nr:amino acid transporter [Chloropicon primus]UPR03616.1 amino acid transporter [Chloropicon primus]|eukprot:QDZ24408.1 amino acid transporter [Chloropicon primus]
MQAETKQNPVAEAPVSDNPVIAFFQKVKRVLSQTSETTKLLFAVTVAIGLGLVINLCVPHKDIKKKGSDSIHRLISLAGRVWINSLKLVVLPLIASNMTISVVQIKEIKGAKDLVVRTLGYYFTTTLMAAAIGILLSATILIPNVDDDLDPPKDGETVTSLEKRDVVGQIEAIFYGLVPGNIVSAMGSGNLLGCIIFFITLGALMDHSEKKPSPIYKILKELNDISFMAVQGIIVFTPYAVFCLLYPTIATQKHLEDLITSVLILVCTLTLGIAMHCLISYPSLYFLFTKENPLPFMKNASPAVLTAFSTSSSAATLPVTINVATEVNNISHAVANFVLSLGATVNMDGTAIGFPMSVLFLATAQGEKVHAGRIIMIALVATLASMGAAPVPSAGLVLLVMIMDTVNVPITELFSVIIAIDFLNDRLETMTNVLGDSMAAGIIQNYYSKLLISGTTEQVKRASVLITGQIDDSFKKDSEKLMKRRVSTMSGQEQQAIAQATGLTVADEYLTPSTQPEAVDLQDIPEGSPEREERNVSNPVAPQSNPLYDGVGEP